MLKYGLGIADPGYVTHSVASYSRSQLIEEWKARRGAEAGDSASEIQFRGIGAIAIKAVITPVDDL